MMKRLIIIIILVILSLIGFFEIVYGGEQTFQPIAKSECKTVFPSDNQIEWQCYKVKNEKFLKDFLGNNLEATLRFNRIDRNHALQGAKIKVPVDFKQIADFTPFPKKLPRTNNYSHNYARHVRINLSEQFLSAYELGGLVFSFPISSGKKNSTPRGLFKILARDAKHYSSRYTIKPGIPYPMYWAIEFSKSKAGSGFWIHSRDMPGYPASHGCIGLYDEEMQKKFYGSPKEPMLMDSKKLYTWLFPDIRDIAPKTFPEGLPNVLLEIE